MNWTFQWAWSIRRILIAVWIWYFSSAGCFLCSRYTFQTSFITIDDTAVNDADSVLEVISWFQTKHNFVWSPDSGAINCGGKQADWARILWNDISHKLRQQFIGVSNFWMAVLVIRVYQQPNGNITDKDNCVAQNVQQNHSVIYLYQCMLWTSTYFCADFKESIAIYLWMLNWLAANRAKIFPVPPITNDHTEWRMVGSRRKLQTNLIPRYWMASRLHSNIFMSLQCQPTTNQLYRSDHGMHSKEGWQELRQ